MDNERPKHNYDKLIEESVGIYKWYWINFKRLHPERGIQKDPVDNAEVIPYDYNKKIKLPELECLRCGSKWISRKKKKPVQCPKCKSPYWNEERKKA